MMKAVAVAAAILPLSLSEDTTATDCLCIFDVDRTLTGVQGNPGAKCAGNHVYPGIKDDAYGGGDLTLSDAGYNLDKTFCSKCFASVISHGNAGGAGSQMREKLVMHLNVGKDKRLKVDDTWSMIHSENATDKVNSPLVTSVDEDKKHKAALAVKDWYKENQKVDFNFNNIHFFDDKQANVDSFKNQGGFNARQISCASRDNSREGIGWCGATVAEIKPDPGIYDCPAVPRRRRARRRVAPPPPPPPPPPPTCSDHNPQQGTCQQNKAWNHCQKHWMWDNGLCCKTCFNCKNCKKVMANATDVVV